MASAGERPPAAEAEAHLRAAPPGPDPGGTLDTSAPHDVPLTYRAERVRTVTLDGHALTLCSGLSPAVTTTLHDTFSPAAPTGLLAANGSRPAQTAVDLSWEPGSEPDLAGYVVERLELSGSPSSWQPLTTQPVTTPSFHDATARSGVPYRYRVLAVDSAGNRSPASAPVDITLPPSL